jgi:LysR family hydrogen peroxide-inducible transcriptional activator
MNRLDGLSVHDLRVVAKLADTLHFGKTADGLGVSQPTVSAAVGKFEAVIGYKCFYRTSRRCEITPRGQGAVAHVRAILSELQFLDPVLEDEILSGVLRLGLIPTIAPFYLPHIMQPLQTAFPNLAIYFTEGITERLLDQVRTHQLDAAIVSSFADTHNLERTLLMREPLFVLLPSEHSLAKLERISVEVLLPDELLLLDRGNCLRDQSLRLCDLGLGYDNQAHSTSLATLFYLVASKSGYAIIPEMACEAALQASGVVIRPLVEDRTREIFLVYRSDDRRKSHFEDLIPVLSAAKNR